MGPTLTTSFVPYSLIRIILKSWNRGWIGVQIGKTQDGILKLSTSTPFFSLTGCPPMLWGLGVWASARGLWVIGDIGYGYCVWLLPLAISFWLWLLVISLGYWLWILAIDYWLWSFSTSYYQWLLAISFGHWFLAMAIGYLPWSLAIFMVIVMAIGYFRV